MGMSLGPELVEGSPLGADDGDLLGIALGWNRVEGFPEGAGDG